MIFVHIIQIPIKLSYVLKRWSNVHHIFMEKMENIPHIHKFRNIQLIEHELNFLMSLVWAQQLPYFFFKKKLKKAAEKEDIHMKCCSTKYAHMIFAES